MQPIPRSSGVLLHISSLPGPHGSGDLGPDAFHFVDWLRSAGQSFWQFLPIGGIGLGNSPYMSSSAFAGNVLFIDVAQLVQRGWLSSAELGGVDNLDAHQVRFEAVVPWRMRCLGQAHARFAAHSSKEERDQFSQFCQAQAHWLDDFALFMALSEHYPDMDWADWPSELAMRLPTALQAASKAHAQRIDFWRFCQWIFFQQWRSLRDYAHAQGVQLIGDLPIFVAHHSADVWAQQSLFALDTQGRSSVVAGVPPDSFAEQGQRWGNPLYRWPTHQASGFQWWIARFRHFFSLVDMVRVDHFRGFESYWEIQASEPTAIHGCWVAAPGDALFAALRNVLGKVPIIAEDLGVITPAVEALRLQHGFPGMRVLQFAFGEDQRGDPHHLPHGHRQDAVVYPGTHDNDTAIGWWNSASPALRRHVCDYLACDGSDIAYTLIRTASASVAQLAIYPMQDVLRLGAEHRMNRPGSPQGHWSWRFRWSQVGPEPAAFLHSMAALYGRLPVDKNNPGSA